MNEGPKHLRSDTPTATSSMQNTIFGENLFFITYGSASLKVIMLKSFANFNFHNNLIVFKNKYISVVHHVTRITTSLTFCPFLFIKRVVGGGRKI